MNLNGMLIKNKWFYILYSLYFYLHILYIKSHLISVDNISLCNRCYTMCNVFKIRKILVRY